MLVTPREESTFYHACIEVDGKSIGTGADQLPILDFVKLIYSGFEDRFVAKVIPTKAEEKTEPMSYYADTDNDGLANDAAAVEIERAYKMLQQEGPGNGQCTAWTDFFYEVCKVHGGGIPIKTIRIDPANSGENSFTMKNIIWNSPETQSTTNSNYPYERNVDFSERFPFFPIGLPGQGRVGGLSTSDPPKNFGNHSLARLDQTLFDPSYGTPPITPLYLENELKIYEDTYVELYGLKVLNSNNSAEPFRKNNSVTTTESLPEIKETVSRN